MSRELRRVLKIPDSGVDGLDSTPLLLYGGGGAAILSDVCREANAGISLSSGREILLIFGVEGAAAHRLVKMPISTPRMGAGRGSWWGEREGMRGPLACR